MRAAARLLNVAARLQSPQISASVASPVATAFSSYRSFRYGPPLFYISVTTPRRRWDGPCWLLQAYVPRKYMASSRSHVAAGRQSVNKTHPGAPRSAKGVVIGIDLGTTNSCVAVMEGKVCKGSRHHPLGCSQRAHSPRPSPRLPRSSRMLRVHVQLPQWLPSRTRARSWSACPPSVRHGAGTRARRRLGAPAWGSASETRPQQC